jgi:hypothetical protein
MPSPNYYQGAREASVQQFEPGLPSVLAGPGDTESLQAELQRLARHSQNVVPLLPQVATQAPLEPVEGMIRYAKAPWNPTGLGNGWVQYVNGAWTNWPNAILGDLSVSGVVSHSLGTAALPSITFTGDTNTGIFSPAADQVGISTGGVVRLTVTTAQFTGTLPFRGQNGTVGAPAYSFSGDTNTGMYWVSADVLALATNGVQRLSVSNTAVTTTVPVTLPAVDPVGVNDASRKAYVDARDATKPQAPQTGAGVGQWVALGAVTGSAITLPAGGTWAWFWIAFDMTTSPAGVLNNSTAGVSAGGTAVGGAFAGIQYRGFAWRIT